jgi:SAM-dependent methyltransferase
VMADRDDDWTVGYFDELYLQLFPFPEAAQTDDEVSALVQLLPCPPAKILDLACGQGRHAVRLAQHGYQVVGVDTSRPFLGDAQRAADELGVTLDLVESDMREIAYEREFDGVVSFFTAWGYHDDDENQHVLQRIARSLRDGGRLVMDMIHRDWLMSVYTPKDWLTLRDGTDVVVDRHFDAVRGVNVVSHRWPGPDGRTNERQHRLRIYTATEIDGMLRNAGLRPTAWYGGPSLEPFDHTSRRLLVVADRVQAITDP